MKKLYFGLIVFIIFFSFNLMNLFSFPYNINYTYGIKPSKSQQDMNQDVQYFFEDYKNKYYTQSGTPQSGMWRVKVQGQYGDDGTYYPNSTVSEAQGYGMLIAVLMDNQTNSTKNLYDGLFKYYKYYTNHNGLMKWIIDENGVARSNGAATDGDLDVAMSLIMAHYRWGSSGMINYEEEAREVISNLLKSAVDGYNILKPGDSWGGDSITRPSDYVTGFFKVFYYFTGDQRWQKVVENCYSTLDYFYKNYNTGLVADFCRANGLVANMVVENTLSQNPPTDYIYGYNACRVPWRLGFDWLWFGDERAYKMLHKVSVWLKSKTNNNVNAIRDGYTLDGQTLSSWQSPAFVAPFGVAAASSLEHQQWLNDIYNWLVNKPFYGYYADSIRLLSLLLITGNFPNFIFSNPGIYLLNLTNDMVISDKYDIEVGAISVSTANIKIEFFLNGEIKFVDDRYPFIWSLDTKAYEDGMYQINVKSYSDNQFLEEKVVTVRIKNIKSSQMYVDNNPYIISTHKICKFYNIPSGKTVSIYKTSGELVTTLTSKNGIAEWEGKDKTGRYVNSDVYLWVVEDKVQKIAVIK